MCNYTFLKSPCGSSLLTISNSQRYVNFQFAKYNSKEKSGSCSWHLDASNHQDNNFLSDYEKQQLTGVQKFLKEKPLKKVKLCCGSLVSIQKDFWATATFKDVTKVLFCLNDFNVDPHIICSSLIHLNLVPSCRNQAIDLIWKSIYSFLFDGIMAINEIKCIQFEKKIDFMLKYKATETSRSILLN